MTVSSALSRKEYTGDAVTTSFSTSPVEFFETSNLTVYVVVTATGVAETLTENTHYTVSGGDGATGTVNLAGGTSPYGAPAATKTVVIQRTVPRTQQTDFVQNDGSDAEVFEEALDRLTMQVQEQDTSLGRVLRQPDSDPTAIAELPNAVDRASLYMAFDADGDPVVTAGTTSNLIATAFIETLLDDGTAADARATLGAVSSAAGAVVAANLGTGAITAIKLATSALGRSNTLINGTLVHSRAASAETISLKTLAGTDPSATDPVLVVFRNATAATGDYAVLSITAAASITISSGSTLAFKNSTAQRLWIVGFNDGGTFRLGVINCIALGALSGTSDENVESIYPLRGWGIASSTAEGGAGGADNRKLFYTGTAVTSKAYAVLGYSTWESGLATAGTWDTAPTRTQLFGPGVPLPGDILQITRANDGAVATGTTTIPRDDTIPQNTEGDQYLSEAITCTSAANAIRTRVSAMLSNGTAGYVASAIFRDTTANAMAVGAAHPGATARSVMHYVENMILARTTSTVTMKYRAGGDAAGTTTFNGESGARTFGNRSGSFMECAEIMT